MPSIAIVGMACRYPDARNPAELWESVLAQRRAFRRMPAERMSMDDYYNPDRAAADSTYSREAALIEGYEFDRVRFRVTGDAYRSADPAHWLALDIASQALSDAGFAEGAGLPRDSTGVILANTLTGDASRAGLMRLRWPYVRRVVGSALAGKGWAQAAVTEFLDELEEMYKAPFAPIGEESLAGGLSNTIAGRICNHFDLKGCGYTVDGACAASLLAISGACTALESGDLDVALAGGVDLSIDPFELVGFAKAGALAEKEMRVYDARSQGFWPGEGCGFVVLMRLEDALAKKMHIYAVVRGWGISSDGSGGITRPEADGQLLALTRAYRRAGFGVDTIGYFEGHGTGTHVGDTTELTVLSTARRRANSVSTPAAIGSIKANIGHTKAAAGLAGFIKAALAVQHRIIPPMTGCTQPHPLLSEERPAVRVPQGAERWPDDAPARAGVSAMGFGGVNTHVVIEECTQAGAAHPEVRLDSSGVQDAEVFLFADDTREGLERGIRRIHEYAARLSRAELTDLAVASQPAAGKIRAAVVASTPTELSDRLATLLEALKSGHDKKLDIESGVFLGESSTPPRIGFVFPGQGSPSNRDGGLWRRRFPQVADLYDRAALSTGGDDIATQIAQPAIVTASLAALRVLEDACIHATAVVGHSLGELTALHWAGAFDGQALVRIARARGQAMADLRGPTGQMLAVAAGPAEIESIMADIPVRIAAFNTPKLTVVSGEGRAVAQVARRAAAQELKTTKLRVSHAFHSPLVAPAATTLSKHLAEEHFRPLERVVYSTVTGSLLGADHDLRDLLVRQVTSPVRFVEAARQMAGQVDLFLEVGPGQVMNGLLREFTDPPVISVDAGGPSLIGLLQAFAAAFVLGAPVDSTGLFAGRFSRPFSLEWQPKFFANPCEAAPTIQNEPGARRAGRAVLGVEPSAPVGGAPLDVVRQLIARRAELPVESVREDSRLLGDLHLNSIMVGQVVAEASRQLGLPPPVAPTEFASATVGAVAKALEELVCTDHGGRDRRPEGPPAGVDTWFRAMTVEWIERPLESRRSPGLRGRQTSWRVIAPPNTPLADRLNSNLARGADGGGAVVVLPSYLGEDAVEYFLQAAKGVLADREASRFVLVQEECGTESFAKSLYHEAPHLGVRVVTVPFDHPRAAEWVLAEVAEAAPFSESRYDVAGRRWTPVLRVQPSQASEPVPPLSSDDVLLVTGGAKGIAAECALALARETGVALVLIGRSSPDSDPVLAANLERFRAANVRFLYVSADVCDAAAMGEAVRNAQAALGPITAFIHGAGTNEPKLIENLTHEDFRRTYCPKVQGARNVLSSLDPAKLRLFVTFGSIIARAGLRGEADYALANDWLAKLTETWQRNNPDCRCVCVEWSVWSGVGMGERLGRIEALAAQGISPIPPDQGVRLLRELLSQRLPAVRLVVSGRFGQMPTLAFDRSQPAFLRFMEEPKVFYPGIELVADAELSSQSDPYLDDHVFHGERLLPAVMGLEAMAQAVMGVTGIDRPPTFENVSFARPIAVPTDGAAELRVAVLARQDGSLDVVLRTSATDFAVDHFRATCRMTAETGTPEPPVKRDINLASAPALVNPDGDLYGRLLFHTGRFRRITGYRLLRADECLAELAGAAGDDWFGRVLPGHMVLGDPAARDAAIHAIQACIPHATILPTAVDRITLFPSTQTPARFVHAVERSRDGDHFVYDVEMLAADGAVVERWDGLHLKIIESARSLDEWPIGLFAPYLQRCISELVPGSMTRVAVGQNGNGAHGDDRDGAVHAALETDDAIHRRPDGKPDAGNGRCISASHAGDLTLAVAGRGSVGCDMEEIAQRPADVWQGLLGAQHWKLAQRLAAESGDNESAAATRVWTVLESMKKAGLPHDAPLTLDAAPAAPQEGWARLRSGRHVAASLVTTVRGHPGRLAAAVLVEDGDAGL